MRLLFKHLCDGPGGRFPIYAKGSSVKRDRDGNIVDIGARKAIRAFRRVAKRFPTFTGFVPKTFAVYDPAGKLAKKG